MSEIKINVVEFDQSFSGYVIREKTYVDDHRPMVIEKYLELPPEKLVAYMAEVPYDIAAILSGVVKVNSSGELESSNPAAVRLIDGMKEIPWGKELCEHIAAYLKWASEQPDLKRFLCK